MAKRKTKKKLKRKNSKSSQINYKLINIILSIIIVVILIIGYIVYTSDTKELKKVNEESKVRIEKVETSIKNGIKKVEEETSKELENYVHKLEIKKDKFEEYTKDFYEEYVDKELSTEKKKIEKPLETKIKKEFEVKDKPKAVETNKPKLAIVMDDVTTKHQLKQINNIGYTVTASILPPTNNHPHSAKIAQNLPFYMIHFPMQATNFKGEEANTLHIGDSYETIEKRVSQIRKWYPDAKYTNNHTGSKFTADYISMDYFFKALIKYDFIFVDSRTTSKSVGKQLAKKYNMPYIVRNVFLDNEQDFNYIQNQLKKAIKIAKKNGEEIAICHPHSITMKVLKESKHLLADLEMVYLNQLPSLNR